MRRKIYIGFVMLILLISGVGAQENELYSVKSLPVNSRYFNDMTPVITEDAIIFSSDRKRPGLWDVRDFNRNLMYNIYSASRIDSIEYDKAGVLTGDFSRLANQGPFCFTPDGQQLYYTSNIIQDKRAQRRGINNNMGIFIADKVGDSWTNIRQFKYNDPLWNVAHPNISSDGKYLFFASDIPGGQGGSDIWYCEWINGEWTDPVNLGPEVNSASSDLYPYFSPSQELYFASNRTGGVGGLDIYSSSLRFGQWNSPVLMPEPINSTADDFSYLADEGSSNSYFTSNRGRNDDIYKVESLIRRMSNCDTMLEDNFCWTFFDEQASSLDKSLYEYEWDFDDGEKSRGDTVDHCFKEEGDYLIKLNVIDVAFGNVSYNEATYPLEVRKHIQAYFESPDSCFVGESISFDASRTNLPEWNIVKYYWNFDDGTINTGIKSDKVFASAGTYIVQLIVTAAPDANGVINEKCVSKNIIVKERQ